MAKKTITTLLIVTAGILVAILLSYTAILFLTPGAESEIWNTQAPLNTLEKTGLTGKPTPLRFITWLLTGNYTTLTLGTVTWKTPLRLVLLTLTPITLGALLGLVVGLLAYSFNLARKTSRILGLMPGLIYAIIFRALAIGLGATPGNLLSGGIIYTLVSASVTGGRVLLQAYQKTGPQEPYYLAHLAVGNPEWRARLKALRPRFPEIVSLTVSTIGIIASRSIILEPIIGYPGLGYLLASAIVMGDPLLAGLLLAYLTVTAGVMQGVGQYLGARI